MQSDATVNDDTLHLMELSQVGRVQRLVSEDSIDREVLHRLEILLLCLLKEHLRADRCCVRSQDVLHRFFGAPARTVAVGAGQTVLVRALHALFILFRHTIAVDGILAEERILQIACWMALRLEQRVEVPEGALDPAICRHLIEAH